MVKSAPRFFASCLALALFLSPGAGARQAAPTLVDPVSLAHQNIMFGSEEERDGAVDYLKGLGNLDAIPTLLLALRLGRHGSAQYISAFEAITGHEVNDWFEAALWLEDHPEATPHPSYRAIKLQVYEQIDENFRRFLGGDLSRPENMKIRLEEIYWGGVKVDGIPPLDNPPMVAADGADYLLDDDLVFGIEINGDARAYPLRIMGWHEMFNDVIGGVPVALAYCTLCGSGILYDTTVEGRGEPFIFSTSGLLYRSNKLMYDRQTDSLWNQFTGQPVSGALRNSGIELKIRPMAITTWADWREHHADTRVLDIDTGHWRDYGSGVVYRDYFASDDLMFPARVRDEENLKKKDYVFGMRGFSVAKAWPLSAFAEGAVINDMLGDQNVVLVGNAAGRTVRAYQRGSEVFSQGANAETLRGKEGSWQITEEALLGPRGQKLPRLPGHIAYWFAWENYFGGATLSREGGS